MSIKKKILYKINKNGNKLRVDKFISNLLFKKNSYYTSQNPIGSKNDYITSPEISQMFGEILGVYILNYWLKNITSEFNLIELGPGRGTLLQDIMRSTKSNKIFNLSANIKLLEKNKKLIEIQKEILSNFKMNNIEWIKNFEIKSNLPSIIYANEFFDCLPVRQFYKNINWFEKFISYNHSKDIFSLINKKVTNKKLLKKLDNFNINQIAEISYDRTVLFKNLCKHIYKNKGLIILIDYGYITPIKNFTLQAISRHKKTHIFDNLGLQDITSYVNFDELINIANKFNFDNISYLTQRDFLISNGIIQRKEILKKKLSNEKKELIEKQFKKLTDIKSMGNDFKFLIIY